MTFHIRILTPHVSPVPRKLEEVQDLAAAADLRFSQTNIAQGPVSIECAFDEVLCAPGLLARALEAEAEGVQALIIDCFADPALDAVREAVRIPVIGPGQAAMHVAAALGHRFGIVTVLDSVVPMIEARARLAGLHAHLAGVRAVDVPVREIGHDHALLLDKLLQAAEHSVREDRADAIVLGCTGFLGLGTALHQALQARGLPVPVVNPLRAAVGWAAMALQSQLFHSPLAYPAPRGKPVTGFRLPPITKPVVDGRQQAVRDSVPSGA